MIVKPLKGAEGGAVTAVDAHRGFPSRVPVCPWPEPSAAVVPWPSLNSHEAISPAGPPRKLRWTYRLVPALTDRERDAIAKVDRMRSAARFLPYDRYVESGAK